MVIQNENVKMLVDSYGDDLYRFAFVLTCSDEGAASTLAEAFSNLEGDKKFTESKAENRLMALSEIYKCAPSFAKLTDVEAIKRKYGDKGEEFYIFLGKPLYEKALTHLTLYEGMTDAEAKEVLKKK